MATKMDVLVFLVTALALGAPSMCAHRDLLTLQDVENPLTGQTVTLLDIPGLRITSSTQAPIGRVPNPAEILSGNGPAPTIYISDKIEGTSLPSITFTSTTELPTKLISSILQQLKAAGSSLAAADTDDDSDVDVPDVVDVSTVTPSTTLHQVNPEFYIPLPELPFPFGSPSPSPSPPHRAPSPSPRARHHGASTPSPSSHHRETSPHAPALAPRRHETPSSPRRSSGSDSNAP